MVAHNKVAENAVAEPRSRLERNCGGASSSSSSSCREPAVAAAPPAGPAPALGGDTHFRTFRSHADFSLITRTSSLLEACGFYWGPMTVHAAHEKLKGEPAGTFLVRDSRQKNCFFAISVNTSSGPTSVRILFQGGRFSLDGSKESFDCIFKLVEHYVTSPKKVLVTPLRKVKLRSLQELCRKSIVATFGRDNLDNVSLNPVLKDYLKSFPFQI
ncbi:LOW QUALITY PROTEIN: suppressor of cytokine signaling 1 [Rhinatrema bivittatum]|uniref:LOW QUALITY PROTEIN: suppressor of cytokine signaling 1 n=1 Tax=Rhinatrema bivittatum TaxID=194408 RepID=UPI001126A6B9|nr:LOW QUALITY PROTEIN: suppressor of cytokine signaling 1 [Rhinatrema bivittatum]